MVPTSNLEPVMNDLNNINEGLLHLGFSEENIVRLENKNAKTIKDTLLRVSKEVKQERLRGGCTLVFIYYGGHGAMDNRTYCINGDGSTVELEKIIRGFAGR